MEMSFLPGELHLTMTQDGVYLITIQGEEVFRTRKEKTAIREYSKIRRDMEAQFPAHEMSHEEKTALLLNFIVNNSFHSNSFRTRPKKKITPGSTRTFG